MNTRTISSETGLAAPQRRESGSITFIFIALLAIMMILVTAESRALYHLRREVKFLEQKQNKQLVVPQTNVATNIMSKPQ